MTTVIVHNSPLVAVNGRGPIEHLKYQYRAFNKAHQKTGKVDLRKKAVMWKDFPIDFRMTETVEPYQWRGSWRNRVIEGAEIAKRLTFVARLDEIENQPRTGRGYWNPYAISRTALTHKFVAPFGPLNEGLLLETAFQLFLRGDEASVLLDEAMENGFKHGTDFERIKSSNYVRVESDDFRLFMSENAHKWPPFELVFDIGVWMGCEFTFSIEPVPQPSSK